MLIKRGGVVRECSERDYKLRFKYQGYKIIEEKATVEVEKPQNERTYLIEQLEALGVKYDKRWGVDKLKEAIKGA